LEAWRCDAQNLSLTLYYEDVLCLWFYKWQILEPPHRTAPHRTATSPLDRHAGDLARGHLSLLQKNAPVWQKVCHL
jgi:hypothetical protein